MADRDLTINLKLLKTAAETASRQFHAAEKQRIAKTLSDHEVAEKAKTAIIARENKQRVREAVRAHKTAIDRRNDEARAAQRAAREQAAAEKRAASEAEKAKRDAAREAAKAAAQAAREAVKAARQAASEQKQAAREAARAAVQAARQAAAEERRLKRESETAERRRLRELAAEQQRAVREAMAAQRAATRQEQREKRDADREEKRLLRELTKQYKANYRERQKEKNEQAKESMRLLAMEGEGWGGLNTKILDGAKQVGAFGLAMVGLNSVSAVLGEIEAGFQRTRDAIFNSSELLHEFREGLLDLAALKDRTGDTSAEMMETLKLQSRTGQSAEDVKALQKSFLGAGESAIKGGKITKEEANKTMERLGQFQAVQGGDATSYGDLGAMLLQMMKPKDGKQLTGEEVSNEAVAIYELSKPGKFRDDVKGLMTQVGKLSPYIQQGVISMRDAVSLVSAYSLSEPEAAGERAVQFIAGTLGAQGRNSKVRGAEGSNNVGTAEYLKSIGAGVMGMKAADIGKLVQKDISRAEAEAKGKGEGFNPYAYLQSKGYGNRGAMNAILGFGGMVEGGSFKVFEDIANDQKLGSGGIAEAQKSLRKEQVFQQRRANAAIEVAKMVPAAGQKENLDPLYAAEYARMKVENPGMPDLDVVRTASPIGATELIYGYRRQLDARVQRRLKRYAAGNNIPINEERAPLGSTAAGVLGQFVGTPLSILSGANTQAVGFQASGFTVPPEEMNRVANDLARSGVDFAGASQAEVNQRLQDNLSRGERGSGGLGRVVDKFDKAVDKMAGAQARRPPLMPGRPVQPPAAPPGQQ